MKKKWITADYILFLMACLIMVLCLGFICYFIFSGGIEAIRKIGLVSFLTGKEWRPEIDVFGILPMILGSLMVTVIALILACPIGILCAIFIARFCPRQFKSIFVASVDLLSSIPSVVYGFVGLQVVVPFIRELFGGSGSSIAAASIVLAVMILPTIASVSRAAIEAVGSEYLEGAVALGDSRERGIFLVELKVCRSSILAAIVLALGRAVGETMAVIMVAGNQPIMPRGLFRGARTLTANIALEMGYATGNHRGALIATAAVLFAFILLVNGAVSALKRNSRE